MIKPKPYVHRKFNSNQQPPTKSDESTHSKKTNITGKELNRMSDDEIIRYIQQYPFKNQWNDPNSWNYATQRLNSMKR